MDSFYMNIQKTIHTDHLDDDTHQYRVEREEVEKLISYLVDMKVRNQKSQTHCLISSNTK